MKAALDLAKHIKILILDVDGVLTDGSLYYDNEGEEYKAFNSKDGHGIRMLEDAGIRVALLTGRTSQALLHRAKNLKLSPELIFQGHRDKRPAFEELLEKTRVSRQRIAYVGDDIVDLPVMNRVGFAVAVADAHDFVIKHADYVTRMPGGRGAVREVAELILESQGKLQIMLDSYLKS